MRLIDLIENPGEMTAFGMTPAISHYRDFQMATVEAYREYRRLLSKTPVRHVLTPEVAASAARMAHEQRATLAKAMPHIRVPYPNWFVEWPFHQCLEVLRKLGCPIADDAPGRRQPERVGLLIESDGKGRSGIAHVLWTLDGLNTGVAIYALSFDFDSDEPRGFPFEVVSYPRGITNHFALIGDPPCGIDYPGITFLPAEVQNVSQEVGMFVAILCLLSAKRATKEVEHDFTRLNKARAKRREAPLSSYREVQLNLSRVQQRRADTAAAGGDRRSPTFHWVTAHLKVRKHGVYLWSSHSRGAVPSGKEPQPLKRTVTVSS